MKKTILFIILVAIFTLHCTSEEEPLICNHLYGWLINEEDSVTGVNDIVLEIKDRKPDDLSQWRIREDTTRTEDSLMGFFEMDNVCYGTTFSQGVGNVVIRADSTKNPGWPTQFWSPTIRGDIDTIILYITKKIDTINYIK